jgi:DNA mismatch endonuclease, patch repair protein
MADVHTKEQRSYNMSRIKGKNIRPEMQVSRFLHAHGYRYRLHDKNFPANPVLFCQNKKTYSIYGPRRYQFYL